MKNLNWFLLATFLLSSACNQAQQMTEKNTDAATDKTEMSASTALEVDVVEKVEKSDEEWAAELTKEEFYVLRQKGTERSFSGDLLTQKEAGTYICAGCSLPLFSSETKFKSGTGWPSYYAPIDSKYVATEKDDKYGWNRVEVLCARCDGHLGHVFDDGPAPTGLRYCINAVSLDFVPAK